MFSFVLWYINYSRFVQFLSMSLLEWICLLVVQYPTFSFQINYHQRDGSHVPCTFMDTVNITNSYHLPNGSYLYNGIIIPPYLVGWYDYIYTDLISQIEVKSHLRGCVCKLKPCISFCCPWGSRYNGSKSSCIPSTSNFATIEPFLNITLRNGTEMLVDVNKQFVVQPFRPCQSMFLLQPEKTYGDEWILYENGSIYRYYDSKILQKDAYCFIPTIYNGTFGETEIILNPANCVENVYDTATMKTINAYAMMFSIPFMLLTIIVYLSIPELRNQHGKSLVSYLFGLCVGYSMLCYNTLTERYANHSLLCKISGYAAYYFFMTAFLWLSVISFDLWHNFRGARGVNRFHEKKRFFLYSIYAWGLAGVFFVFTWYAQEKADIPINFKPGIDDSLCWLNVKEWSAMIYFFGPLIVIILANIVMFVMTALKIHHVQCEMTKIMAREDSNRSLRSEKDKFGLFLRLFIVMGVTWLMEIFSYFSGTNETWSVVFCVTDICNAIQGFVIFMLFVMKKKVKDLIIKRCLRVDTKAQRNSQCSSKTTTSSVTNLSINSPLSTSNPWILQNTGFTNVRRL